MPSSKSVWNRSFLRYKFFVKHQTQTVNDHLIERFESLYLNRDHSVLVNNLVIALSQPTKIEQTMTNILVPICHNDNGENLEVRGK